MASASRHCSVPRSCKPNKKDGTVITSAMNSTTLLQFRNCTLLRNHEVIKEDLWVRDGKILNPEFLFFDENNYADVQIDCQGALISPGFIDLQLNGGFGTDFSNTIDDVDNGVSNVALGILAHGVTSFCPTMVSSPPEVYKKVLPHLKKRPGGSHGASVLGAHVEGPFINVKKKGAHPAECIQDFSKGFQAVLDVYGSIENITIITLAPEMDNTLPVIEELTKRGIVVSLGHSMANVNDGEVAVLHGASLITHLFNAMLPFHHRDPGLVGLLTSSVIPPERTVYYGMIADGVHTHAAALRIAHLTYPHGLVLVTDAISALGLEEGVHRVGQMTVEIKMSKVFVEGTDILCGSISSMSQCIKFFKEAASCTVVSALEAATLHPAEAIGVQDTKGTLNFGSDADFVLLGQDLDVWSTWIAGECVFQDEEKPKITSKNIIKAA